MATVHGGARQGAGRAKGGKNERTLQWEALGESIMAVHTKRFNEVLTAMDDSDFADNYLKILEYFKPKIARTELTGADGESLTTVVRFTDAE